VKVYQKHLTRKDSSFAGTVGCVLEIFKDDGSLSMKSFYIMISADVISDPSTRGASSQLGWYPVVLRLGLRSSLL
jgi:hypothetical protein